MVSALLASSPAFVAMVVFYGYAAWQIHCLRRDLMAMESLYGYLSKTMDEFTTKTKTGGSVLNNELQPMPIPGARIEWEENGLIMKGKFTRFTKSSGIITDTAIFWIMLDGCDADTCKSISVLKNLKVTLPPPSPDPGYRDNANPAVQA